MAAIILYLGHDLGQDRQDLTIYLAQEISQDTQELPRIFSLGTKFSGRNSHCVEFLCQFVLLFCCCFLGIYSGHLQWAWLNVGDRMCAR